MRIRLVVATVLAAVGIVAVLAWSVADAPSADPPAGRSSTSPSPSSPPASPPSPQRTGQAEAEPAVRRLVIWARGDLTVEFADAVAELDDVLATAHVRSATLGLVAARSADGGTVQSVPEGFRIPVSATAIDPGEYAELAPTGHEALARLQPGTVLLTETGADLRGLTAGGSVSLVGLEGLEVVGVVDDGTVGRAELVLHVADAAAAGMDEDGTVYVRHDADGADASDALVEEIGSLVPPDLRARIVALDADDDGRRSGPLVLSLPEVKLRFGEFAFRPRPGAREVDLEPGFRNEHIVTVEVPLLGNVTCHEAIVEDLRAALRAVADAGLANEIDPSRYGGCYAPRRISVGDDALSRHSWGIAIDINVDLSHPDLGPPPHPDVVAAFEAHGFRWGGDFLRPDNHHFEWVGDVTPIRDRASRAAPDA